MPDRPLFWPTVLFVLLATLVTAIGIVGEQNLRALANGFAWVSHSRAVLDELSLLRADAQEAQSASRGLRMTGEPAFHADFEAARDRGRRHLARLRALTAENPAQSARVDSLTRETEDLYAFLAAVDALAVGAAPEPASRTIIARGGEEIMQKLDARVEELRTEEVALLDARRARADRTYFVARLAGFTLAAASLLLGVLVYVLFARTVAAQRREAQAQHRLATDLADADRRKDEFLAMLGHELRNPLAPIRMSLGVLDHEAAPAAALARAREILEQQVEQMTRLVDDLMDVSRVALGKLSLERQPVEAAWLARAVADAAIPDMARHGHRFELHVPDDPLVVPLDPIRMRQVLHNLLINAAKYTDAGGTIRLRVLADAARDEVVFRVEDTGHGLTEEELGRVFSPFEQGGATRDPADGGMGVGLTLARRLVEMHGGSVRAHSPGRSLGSTFEVRLPRRTF